MLHLCFVFQIILDTQESVLQGLVKHVPLIEQPTEHKRERKGFRSIGQGPSTATDTQMDSSTNDYILINHSIAALSAHPQSPIAQCLTRNKPLSVFVRMQRSSAALLMQRSWRRTWRARVLPMLSYMAMS